MKKIVIFITIFLFYFENIFCFEIDTNFIKLGILNSIQEDEKSLFFTGKINFAGYQANGLAYLSTKSNDYSYELNNARYNLNNAIRDNNGGWFIKGDYSDSNGIKINNLFHILTNGEIDTNFRPQINKSVTHIILEDSSLYISGNFDTINGVNKSNIAKLNIKNGSLDTNWKQNSLINNPGITDFKIHSDYIYISGYLMLHFNFNSLMIRVNKFNGQIDTNWRILNNYSGYISKISFENEYVYCLGQMIDNDEPDSSNNLLKINIESREIDKLWLKYSKFGIFDFIENESYIYFLRYVFNEKSERKGWISKINKKTGLIDTNFNPNVNIGSYIHSGTIDDKFIYLSTNYTYFKNEKRHIFRLNKENGEYDSTWIIDVNSTQPATMNVYGDSLIITGSFQTVGYWLNNLVKYNKNTKKIDYSWKPAVNDEIRASASDDDFIYIIDSKKLIKVDKNTSNTFLLSDEKDTVLIKDIIIDKNYLYALGNYNSFHGKSIFKIFRFDLVKKNIDTTWISNVKGTIRHFKIFKEEIFLLGNMYIDSEDEDYNILKLNKENGKILDLNKFKSIDGYFYNVIKENDFIYLGGEFYNLPRSHNSKFIVKYKDSKEELNLLWYKTFLHEPKDKYDYNFSFLNSFIIHDDYIYAVGIFNRIDGIKFEDIVKINKNNGKIILDFDIDYIYTGGNLELTPSLMNIYNDNLYIKGIFGNSEAGIHKVLLNKNKPQTFSISGNIKSYGKGIEKIVVKYTTRGNYNFLLDSLTSNEEGKYEFKDVQKYNYLVYPESETHYFIPSLYEIELTNDTTDINFEAFLKDNSSVEKQTLTPKFFPNPASESITISGIGQGKIEIYNTVGQKLIEKEIFGRSTINTSTLQTGMYVIKLESGGEVVFEKVIVNR